MPSSDVVREAMAYSECWGKSMFEFVVSTKDSKVSLFKASGRRPSSSFHRLCIVVEGGKGRQSVLGRPRPLKLEMSTLMLFEIMMCAVARLCMTFVGWRIRCFLAYEVSLEVYCTVVSPVGKLKGLRRCATSISDSVSAWNIQRLHSLSEVVRARLAEICTAVVPERSGDARKRAAQSNLGLLAAKKSIAETTASLRVFRPSDSDPTTPTK